MTALYAVVFALGLVVLLLALLVVGLLRSHGEMLRRLDSLDAGQPEGHDHRSGLQLDTAADGHPGRPASEVVGITPAGEALVLSPGSGTVPTLLAFLSTSCSSCTPFWENIDTDFRYFGGHRFRVVVVTRGESEESPTRAAALRRGDAVVVMSEGAWDEFGVPGAPYFVLVDPATGAVIGEGSASSFESLEEFLVDASNDRRWDRSRSGGSGAGENEGRIDSDLSRAGIEPGDPRLYPSPGDIAEGESQ